MIDKTATFRVELYYEGSAAESRSEPVVSLVTLAEGANLYLEDKAHDHPNLPHYNFRIVTITADAVILEQIPDRRGKIQPFYTGAASPTRQLRLERGRPLSGSLNVPSGRPVWTITWIVADYRKPSLFFAMYLDNPSFSVEDAVELLGEKRHGWSPHGIPLKPRSPDVQSAELEILGGSLHGISIHFAAGHHPSVSFSALIKDYGEPRKLPLPPPNIPPGGYYHPDHSYSFDGRRVLAGDLIVTVEGERKGDLNPVVAVIYRRWRP